MKRRLKWWVVLLGVLVALFILIIALGTGNTSKNRAIARDLLELKRKPRLLQNPTNLPIHYNLSPPPPTDPTSEQIMIWRNYDFVVTHVTESYLLENSTTNSSEWALYHYWNWNGHQLGARKLLTIVETNNNPR